MFFLCKKLMMRKLLLLFGLLSNVIVHAQVVMSEGTFSVCDDSFLDPGGTLNYPGGTIITTTLVSADGGGLVVTFSFLDLTFGEDLLYVFEGESAASPLLAVLTGSLVDYSLCIPSGVVTFGLFVASTGNTGWQATVACESCESAELPVVAMSNTRVNTCGARFYDSGGPDENYSNDESLITTFCSTDFIHPLIAWFETLSIHYQQDYLYVYDGASIDDPLIAQFTGGGYTSPIVASSQACLTFQFISGSGQTEEGWDGRVTCLNGIEVGIEEDTSFLVDVYPNPASEHCSIECAGAFEYFVYQSSGMLVLHGSGFGFEQLDIRSWDAGFYLLEVRSGKGLGQFKVVKE